MFGRIRSISVMAGAVAAVALWWPLLALGFGPVPVLFLEAAQAATGGFAEGTRDGEYLYFALLCLSVLSASLLAFVAGGLVAGVLAGPSPSLNGSASAMVGLMAGFGRTLWSWLPFITIHDPIARADNIGTFSFWLTGLCFLAPLAVVAASFGGRLLGGRIRGANATRTIS